MAKVKYDNDFKYKTIQSFCDGKNTLEIKEIYGVSPGSFLRWVRKFISDGPFEKEDELSDKRKDFLEDLRKKATTRELETRMLGTSRSVDFKWLLEYDEELEQWRGFTEEWLKTQTRAKDDCMAALTSFFKNYVIPKQNNISRTVADFLLSEYNAPDFYEICFKSYQSTGNATKRAKKIVEFIDWILLEKFSDEDDFGTKIIPDEFCNPLKKYILNGSNSNTPKLSQSNKNVLPYKLITDLRLILCPNNAISFKDWTWAQ